MKIRVTIIISKLDLKEKKKGKLPRKRENERDQVVRTGFTLDSD